MGQRRTQRSWVRVGKAVGAIAREKQISLTAAGLGYYAFNSLVPLLLLLLIGVTAVESVETAATAIERVAGIEAARIESTMSEAIGEGRGRRSAGLLASGMLLWSAATMFQAVNMAFSEIYGTRKRRSATQKVVDTALIFVAVVVSFCLVGVLGVTLVVLTDALALAILSVPLLFCLLCLAFFPMYLRFPGEGVTLQEAVPGTAFSAATWTLSSLLFRFYASGSDSVEFYGVAGAVLLVLTWLYLGGLALLLGAILNAFLAGRVDADDDWLPAA
ncbi:YihY/virulence factor BrkB family protein [Haloferacaceae archaeon DSL9]